MSSYCNLCGVTCPGKYKVVMPGRVKTLSFCGICFEEVREKTPAQIRKMIKDRKV